MTDQTTSPDGLERRLLTEREITDIRERELANKRADNARSEFLKRLYEGPISAVAAEVDAQRGLLNWTEGEILKSQAQRLIDKRTTELDEINDQSLAGVLAEVEGLHEASNEIHADHAALIEDIDHGLTELSDALKTFSTLVHERKAMEKELEYLTEQRLPPMYERAENPEAYYRYHERKWAQVRPTLNGLPPRLPSTGPDAGRVTFIKMSSDPVKPPTEPAQD